MTAARGWGSDAVRYGRVSQSFRWLVAAGLSAWERRTAWVIHTLLYRRILGILSSQAAGKPVSVFDWFTLPQLVPVDPSVPITQRQLVIASAVLRTVVIKLALFAAVALHVAGAFKHAFIDRDPAMVRRMRGR